MARYITIFDLTKWYYQIPVHQDSIEKTAFVTPVGKHEFIIMPFGLMGALSVFQRLLNVVLSEALRNYSRPRGRKEVRAFLGLTNYYRKFIRRFAMIALPLTKATRKNEPDVVVWTKDRIKAFEKLKNVLTSESVLASPDTTWPFILQTNVSGVPPVAWGKDQAWLLCSTDDSRHRAFLYHPFLAQAPLGMPMDWFEPRLFTSSSICGNFAKGHPVCRQMNGIHIARFNLDMCC